MDNLTLIIPAKNENESLPIFLDELKNYNCKKLIIIQRDDISTKQSVLEDDNTKILYQKINGYGGAIIEGINNSTTKFSCIINADGSMNPKYLGEMLNICINQDLVFASRYIKPTGGSDVSIKYLLNGFLHFWYFCINLIYLTFCSHIF